MGKLYLKTPATLLPLTLAEVKVQLREVETDQDTLITGMIEAATQECEGILHRSIMPATWVWSADEFPCGPIIIPMPARAISSVKYYDAALTQQTLAPTTGWDSSTAEDYRALVFPAGTQSWPTTGARPGGVQVEFTAGWVDAASVPRVIKNWILLRVGAYFLHRESWTYSQIIARNEHIDRMLDRWVVPFV